MKRPLYFVLGLISLSIILGLDALPPEATISNGMVSAKLYLPDPVNGYYRGSRFDWAGVIYDLEYKNHHYFGKWFERYEPTLHDATMGPVDSFNPIGYEEAKTGEGFLRIGVGILEKPDEPRYTYSKTYDIQNGGKWKVKKKGSSIEFTHTLKDKKYQYVYTKNLTLTNDKPELVIEYMLKNTGTTTIETDVYNHNFFVMDHEPTGPDFIVKLPFAPQGELKGNVEAGVIDGNTITYKKALSKGESFAVSPLTGYGANPSDYDLRVENTKTGTGVRIRGDKPLVKFVYWSAPATVCPEPYIHVKVEPGKEMTWSIRYEFY
ncbi:MAG TPA: hypothetical protein VK589_14110 [Chryseolinea sp.]|nr:hypothetical protein [Chryseolinea sp.]